MGNMSESEAIRLGEALLRLHLSPDWSFGFDNAKKRAGMCNFTKQHITVSKYYVRVSSASQVAQIILHEIAHALAGPNVGHGKEWLSIARRIGYVGGRTISFNFAEEVSPWVGNCPAGHQHVRFRRPTKKLSCAKCSNTYSSAHAIAWRRRELT